MTRVLTFASALAVVAGCQYGAADQPTQRVAQYQTAAHRAEQALRRPPDQRWTDVDDNLIAPVWVGDDDQGAVYMPLYRGAATAIEDITYTPPDHDCRVFHATARIDWDSSTNRVNVLLKYLNIPVSPFVHRTEGVDWFPNPFHDTPPAFDDGAYRFWIITGATTRSANFWYDGATHQLQGSDFNFPSGPPAGAFPVRLPIFVLSASRLFQANPTGPLTVHEYSIPYDAITAEASTYSGVEITFAPLDICQGNPVQPIAGQLRPVVSPWLHESVSWRTVLRSALAVDTTVEENRIFTGNEGFPSYVYAGSAFLGNLPATQGGIPNGYRLSLPSIIQNVAPVIRPVTGGNGLGCVQSLNDPHVTGPNLCGG